MRSVEDDPSDGPFTSCHSMGTHYPLAIPHGLLSLIARQPSVHFSYPCLGTKPVSGPAYGPLTRYQIYNI